MEIDTRSAPFFLAYPTANSTATSITFPVPTLTEPTGDGVIGMNRSSGYSGEYSANGLIIIPYGAGSATNTMLMNCYGWRPTIGRLAKPLWVAFELATFTVTLCTVPGIAGADVNESQLFAGTISLGVGTANVSNEIVSPTGNVVGHILLDTKGCVLVQILFDRNSSSTSCNALVARM